MPNSIDNKIVEMQFDNANFEKNVKQSIKTLEQLNKALELEDAAKGFEQMEKAANDVDFTALTRAAEMIEKRFSAAGIAGAAMIERLTNSAINMVTGFGRKIVNLAKSGGIARAFKLEHANFMLNGLIKNSQKVADILNGPVNNAVSGTAYGLDSAANAAGQFVAAGLTDLDKLETALTGISGVAAISGASYDEIARIFNKVASRGKVMGDTIQELSTRGIAAQEELAKYLHKTTAEVQEMQKKGQISFDIFANAMNDAFGKQAKKANETFTGAMSNVKAALSRIGAKIATPGIEALRKILVELINVVNQVNKFLSNDIIKRIVTAIEEFGKFATSLLKSKNFMIMVEGIINNLADSFEMLIEVITVVHQAFKAIFPKSAITNLINFNKNFSKFLNNIRLTSHDAAKLEMTLQGLFSILDIIFTLVSQVFEVLTPGLNTLFKSTDSLSSKILTLTSFVGYCLKVFANWLKQNNIFKKGIDAVTKALHSLTSETNIFGKIIRGIGTVIASVVYVFYLIGKAIVTFIQKAYQLPVVQRIVNDIKDAIIRLGEKAAPLLLILAAGFENLIKNLEKFANGQYMTKGLDRLNNVLNSLYWAGDSAFGVIGSFFGLFKKDGKSVVEKADKVSVSFEKMYSQATNAAGTYGASTRSVKKETDELLDTMDAGATQAKDDLESLSKAGKIFAIGFGASIISAGVNIGRAFNSLAGVLRNVKSMTTSIKFFFEQLNLNLRVKTLLSLAAAIAVFAGSLWVLCQVNPARLILAATAVGVLAYAMSKIALVLSLADPITLEKFKLATHGMMEFAGALLILSASVHVISGLADDIDKLKTSILALIKLMFAMAGAVILMGTFQKNAVQGTTSLLAFAGAIYILMKSLTKIQDLDLNKIEKAMPLLLKIVLGMAGITVAMGLVISPFGGFAFIGVVAGVILLCEELTRLGGINPKALRQVLKIIDEIGLVIQAIIGALVWLKLMEVINSLISIALVNARGITGNLKNMFAVLQKGVKYVGVAAIIASIGIAFKLMADSIVELAALYSADQGAFVAVGTFMAVIVALFAFMVYSLTKIMADLAMVKGADKSMGALLIGVSALLLSMTATIAILGSIDHTAAAVGMIGLMVMIAMLSVVLLGMAELQKRYGGIIQSSIATFVGISILLGVMTATIAVLGILFATDISAFIAGGAALVTLLGMLGFVIKQVAYMGTISTQGVVALGLLSVLFASLGATMWLLKDVTTLNVYANLIGLIVAVEMMVIIVKSLAKDFGGETTKALVAIGVISACMLALAGVGMMLNTINDVGGLFDKLVVLEAAVAGMVGIMYLITNFLNPALLTQGLISIGVITACIAGLSLAANLLAAADINAFWENTKTMLIAVGVLTLAVAALGVLGESGIGEIGAALLLAIGVAMIEFAAAAVIFGVAVDLVAAGMLLMADAFAAMEQIDLIKLAAGLTAMSVSIGLVAIASAGLAVAALGLGSFVVAAGLGVIPIALLGEAFNNLATGVTSFMALDLQGIMTTMIKLGEAIQFVNDRALEFLGFAAIATAVGIACGVLGSGVLFVSSAISILLVGINSFIIAITLLAAAINKILESVDKVINDITSLGEKSINDIYSALIKAAADTLPMAGNEMAKYVIDGFKDGWSEHASGVPQEIVGYLCNAIISEIETYNERLYKVGYDAMDQLCKGVEDAAVIESPSKRMQKDADYLADGLIDQTKKRHKDYKASGEGAAEKWQEGFTDEAGIHSNSDKTEEYADYYAAGMVDETNSLLPDYYGSGQTAASSWGNGFLGTLGNYLSGATTTLSNWIGNPLGFDPMDALNQLTNGYKKEEGATAKKWDTYQLSLRYGHGEDRKRKDLNGMTPEQYAKYMQMQTNATEALEDETAALGDNTKATGGSSKAKKENEKANDKKTKAIDEETEALGEETEATEDNEEAIRAMAEEIEVVTKAYDKLLDTQTYKDTFKLVKRQKGLLGQFWSSLKKDGFDSVGKVETAFSTLNQSLLTTTKAVKKGVYAFNDADKYMKKYKSGTLKSEKDINRVVLETGKTIAKVYADRAKIYSKTGNGVEKMTIRLTKNVKNLAKYATEAKNFVKQLGNVNIQGDIFGESMSKVEDFIRPLREIERFFVNFGTMPNNVKKYLQDIRNELMTFHDSMRILNKSISGTASLLASKNEGLPYVEDAFISLAASMYDGSEAANEYATEHARLLFLMEHGLATIEEVEEHYKSYISRITEALTEYYNTLQETLNNSLDIWTEFDRKMDDQNKDLLSIIDSQLGGYQQWSTMLMELSKRGIEFDLLKELTDSGVQSFGKLKNLLTMTNEEFAYFNLRYIESQQAAKSAADMALAALANARTMASARAASVSGKMSRAQLEESKKAAKYIADNNAAVARYQARYNNMTKRQEKEYLKSLDARQKKEYKAAKKAEEKRLKELKAAAATETAKRAEDERVKALIEGIKTFAEYNELLKTHIDDVGLINEINKQLNETLKDMGDITKSITVQTGTADEALLKFADTLEDTGEDGLTYFEEMAKRVEKFRDGIADTIKSVDMLSDSFANVEKQSIENIMDTLYSNYSGITSSSALFSQISNKGYNAYVMQAVVSAWKSDIAKGNALIEELLKATESQVGQFNAAYEQNYKNANNIANQVTGNAASNTKQTIESIEKEVASKQKILDQRRAELEEMEENLRSARAQEQAVREAEEKRQTEIANGKDMIAYLKNLAKQNKISAKQEKELISLLQKYGGTYKGVKYAMVEAADAGSALINSEKNREFIERMVAEAAEKEREAYEELAKATDKLADAEDELVANEKMLMDESRVYNWFRTYIKSVNAAKEAINKFGKSSLEVERIMTSVNKIMNEFGKEKALFNTSGLFENIKRYAEKSNPFDILTDGVLKFGESITEANEDANAFWSDMLNNLTEYQKQLKSSIQSSSDFFSKFDGSTKKTATNYMSYAQSQIDALKTWRENLLKLADMGLSGEILEKFASQGLSSFEQVNAWANATQEQIGAYNKQWQEYQAQVEKASEAAMTSIVATWSEAGKALSKSLIDSFGNYDKDLLEDAGYEASKMIITGVKNGLTNAMPEIVGVASESTTSEVARQVGKTVGNAINQGLVSAIASSVETTVNAAVEKFKMAVDNINLYIQENLDTDYTITIHVNTDELDAAVARMNAAISGTNVSAMQTSNAVTASQANNATPVTTTSAPASNNTTVNYTQNNYSPKSLSRQEIYRQTQNQLSTIQGVVSAASP